MGQTLTHGVYLPDEGERNCYNGLASNWSILDGAVGTIAEHTTALAGKAPAVHTHTKSDVTDLLNSNFIPSANNSYDLGSSSYQWNNVYSKGYYYNGTAWGLDKANVWTAWQTEEHSTEPLIRLRRPNLQIGDAIPQSTQIIGTIPFADKDNLNLGLIAVRDDTNGNTFLTLVARQRYDSNGRANNGTQYESRIDVGIDSSKNLYLRPNSNNKIDLGTSTNKWKSFNGINPGALSLPVTDTSKIESLEPIDFSQWSVSGSINAYTPDADGWICINIKDTATNSIFIYSSGIYPSTKQFSASAYGNGSQGLGGRLSVMLPVRANIACGIIIKAGSTSDIYCANFYPAQGNV